MTQTPRRRGLQLLSEIAAVGPTPALATEYFAALRARLATRRGRTSLGDLVLGTGAGRCGSTTLSALLRGISSSVSTHENPPIVTWVPRPLEIEFHLERFMTLRRYFACVCDVAHWWLNLVDHVWTHIPDCRLIGLIRDEEECAKSFARVKGSGLGSVNHWNDLVVSPWRPTLWDKAYPHYGAEAVSVEGMDGVRLDQIRRYIREYNGRLRECAAKAPHRVLLASTSELSSLAAQRQFFAFLRRRGRFMSKRLNVDTLRDGREMYRF